MFSCYPEHEFHAPRGLAAPDARHWRLMEIVARTPWFLLTVEMPDENDAGANISTTWCIAWERDLVHTLNTIDTAMIRGLVCMLPAWATPTKQWTAREVGEVWLTRTEAAEEYVSLTDPTGEEFGGVLCSNRTATVTEKRLLLRLEPRLVTTGPGARQARKTVRSGQPAKAGA